MLRDHIDGIPLDLASAMLPFRTRFSPGIQLHIHAHARMQRRHADDGASADKARSIRVSRTTLLRARPESSIDCEEPAAASGLHHMADYYSDTNYSSDAFDTKRDQVTALLDRVAPSKVLDLGANTGAFSRIAATRGAMVIAADMVSLAVERHYRALAEGNVEECCRWSWISSIRPRRSAGTTRNAHLSSNAATWTSSWHWP